MQSTKLVFARALAALVTYLAGTVGSYAQVVQPHAMRVCARAGADVADTMPIDPIPVGCAFVGCCPDCVEATTVDWRVRVGGRAGAVELDLENMPAGARPQLVIGPNARSIDLASIRVSRGESSIKNLPINGGGTAPVVVRARWSLDEPGAKPISLPQRLEFAVEQLLGDVIVNEYAVAYELADCPSPQGDAIVLANQLGSADAVAVLNGRREVGCFSFDVASGKGRIDYPNNLSRQDCSSEASIFAVENAMIVAPNVSAWTEASGDTLPLPLRARQSVPITVWVARAPATCAGTGPRAALCEAEIAVNEMNSIYSENRTGLFFEAEYHNLIGDAAAVDKIGIECPHPEVLGSHERFAALRGDKRVYNENSLNLYLVDAGFTGVTCDVDRKVMYVGTSASNLIPAHEVGHALNLDHTDNLMASGKPRFAAGNLMMQGDAMGRRITLGQAFRMNVHCESPVNQSWMRSNIRKGIVRSCSEVWPTPPNCGKIALSAGTCPPLELDAH